jgi:hypothetical protein
MALEQNLELSVGGSGIIGRRLSVYHFDITDFPVAEAIIGWN